MEKIANFKFENQELTGIVTLPENRFPEREKVGVILSVSGLKYRVCSYRLNVKIARRLSQEGFLVFRFDPLGIGDSEGEFSPALGLKHFLEIQTGRYVKETKAAIDYLKKEYQLDQIVLLGLCGGAINMLITGANDQRVDKLILLGVPVLLENIPQTNLEFKDTITTPEYAEQVLSTYKSKLLSPKAWLRLLTFKSEYKTLIKSLSLYLRKFFKKDISKKHPRFNDLFLSSFKHVISQGKKILFINGEVDPATWEFKSEFEDKYVKNLKNPDSLYRIHLIKKANHIFSLSECQAELLDRISSWLSQEYRGAQK
ncbi:MAG: alpha/beta hydrolase [candidate division Zixibacteria bacterium]|nr:alpha/beta hydrolase [candidate division Zixibacteria bacterium]